MKLLFVGHSRCGKDEAGIWMSKNTRLSFAGTTSKYLAPYVAEHLQMPEHEAYQRRHEPEMQKTWHLIGKRVRHEDPGCLMRQAFKHGDISGGVRDFEEIVDAHRYCDLIIWVDRDVPKDPTLEFDSTYADIIIENKWSLDLYYEKLRALSSALGILNECCPSSGQCSGKRRS